MAMIKKRISECCKKLRLSQNIAENYESIEADNQHEYLLKVLEHEANYREVTRVNRLINQAKFNTLKTFDDYIFDNIKIPSEISIDDLKTASFIDEKKNLVLYGNVGTGKTHLATAIGIEACKRSKKVLFFRTASLVNQLNQAKKKDMLGKLFKKDRQG